MKLLEVEGGSTGSQLWGTRFGKGYGFLVEIVYMTD
jgi:hypothetical protein